jgi:hypothetical protein
MRTRVAMVVVLVLMAMVDGGVRAQTMRRLTESADTHYYDFFVGRWLPVENGRVDTAGTSFTVRRSIHPAAYEEYWEQRVDSQVLRSTALRAWDQVAGRWMFTWVSDNGLYQVWQGEKVGADWYIVREFDFEGQKFLSRQAWIPDGPGRLVRVMERSTDGGKTWQTRSRGTFQRVAPK